MPRCNHDEERDDKITQGPTGGHTNRCISATVACKAFTSFSDSVGYCLLKLIFPLWEDLVKAAITVHNQCLLLLIAALHFSLSCWHINKHGQ